MQVISYLSAKAPALLRLHLHLHLPLPTTITSSAPLHINLHLADMSSSTLSHIAGPSSPHLLSSPSYSLNALLSCTPSLRKHFKSLRLQHVFRHSADPTSLPSRSVLCAVSDVQAHHDNVPVPIVLIDQDSDVNATVVELSFGDRLGALLDTMKALKDLGLDVLKGNVTKEDAVVKTKFFITRSDTGRKIESPELIEAVRLTIIGNLLKYHPESSERLAMGEAWGIKGPEKKIDVDIATHIRIMDDGPKRSLLSIETADRPGLLMEIVQIIHDINVEVESAEIDTEGLVAKDKLHVSYHGQALNKSMAEVLTNCLRYHLRRPITDDESY